MFSRTNLYQSPPGSNGVCTIVVNGTEFKARLGEPLVVALLEISAGKQTEVSNPDSSATSFNPWCMMGACFGCLVEIDGQSVQACQQKVVDGLELEVPAWHLPEAQQQDFAG